MGSEWGDRGMDDSEGRGGFNARTEREKDRTDEGGEKWREDEGEGRNSKGEIINGEERKLMEFIGERRWTIFNENVKKDEEEKYTFTGGKDRTVIDYILENIEIKDRMIRMRVGNRIDSDHQSWRLY